MFEEVGVERSKIRVLHDAVPSPERFKKSSNGKEFREAYEIANDSVLFMQVSKLTRNKGQDRVISAAERLDDRPNIEFAIVGGAVEGHEDYAKSIKVRATNLDSVHDTGFYPDITVALAAADVLVHVPSHEDPFPGVVLEGMLSGIPVIGTRSGGIPEQIDDGKTGVLVPKDASPDDIAAAIKLLADQPEYRDELGQEAHRKVRERFPVEPYFDVIEDLYIQSK